MLVWKSSLRFLDTGAKSPIFGHLNMGTFDEFGPKCPCSGAQKWDERLNPKTETTVSHQHPPKMMVNDDYEDLS